MSQTVSVIMRSKNSDWVIASTLAALNSQRFKDYELIIVDSGSTDNTLKIVSHYPCHLIRIEAADYYPGKVLNDAIEKASGDIIVFVNSDAVLLHERSLEYLLKAFDDPEVAAAFGRQLPRPEAETWVQRDYASSFPDTQTPPEWISLSLPLAAIRRSVWRQHPFYTDAWASEDTEWGRWALSQGYKIRYVPKAQLMHSHNYNSRQLYGRRFVEGEADSYIYQRKPRVLVSLLSWCKSCLRDISVHVVRGDFWGLIKTPWRLAVYEWAYYCGARLGASRQGRGCQDASMAQQVVLHRY